MARHLVVIIAALVIAITIVRNAAVEALADTNPPRAGAFWGRHPSAEINVGMTEIAEAARARKAASAETFQRIDRAARQAPLAPEPFLVRGVQAELSGQTQIAERAFLAAEWRDPRSLPAHYFLAEHFLRARDAKHGLGEVVALANLAPGGPSGAGPYLAAFARDRANWPSMRVLFRENPAIEDTALATLARDAANAPALFALASPRQRQPDSYWLSVLLDTLVKDSAYSRARALWAAASGIPRGSEPLLFDSDFSRPKPLPPFNWALASSTAGLAERQPGGRLHVIFYGQEDGVLARQLLVLTPGTYRLSMRLLSDASQAKALNWAVTCVGARTPLSSAPLDVAASQGVTLQVPPDCRAQWIELSGVAADMPRQADITIVGLRLIQGGGDG
jgi:hypothetical protein